MAEPTQYMFMHKEVVETLIKKQGIHEGQWVLSVEFGLSAVTAGPSDDQLFPTAMVPLLKIGIQKTDQMSNLAVDAAQVNPAAKPKQASTQKKKP